MKKNTLFYLEKAKGTFISGEDIARVLGVSRMSVSKAVTELKKEGAVIESSTKCGYRLIKSTDRLYAESVRAHLKRDLDVYCYESIGSTNEEAKIKAAEGAGHGTVIIAEAQTAGRGRFGRKFYSPSQSGLYMSVIIKPSSLTDGVMYTVAAAVALRRVIGEYAGNAMIKWVNDIYINERKVCGILCEAVSDLESGQLSAVICGIGVNLTVPDGDFPDDIKGKAGSISSEPIDKGEFAARVTDALLEVLTLDSDDIIREYDEYMILRGREIYYDKNGESCHGIVLGTDSSGGLIVKTNSSECEILRSGEVRLEKF